MAQKGEMTLVVGSFDSHPVQGCLQQPVHQDTNGKKVVWMPVLRVCDLRQRRTDSMQWSRMALGIITARRKMIALTWSKEVGQFHP